MLPAVCLTVISLVLLLVAEQRGSALGKWLTKPAASLGFIWAALASGALSSTWGRVVLAGLVLSMLGDILLIPKDKRAFLAGLISFLLGHVAYVVAFGLRGIAGPPVGMALVPLVLVGAVVLRWLWPHLPGRMRIPVLAYVLIISAMVAMAVGTVAHTFDPRIMTGAVLFFLSDLFVARNRFVLPGFVNRLFGLPLYFAGQLLIAASVDGEIFASLLIPLFSFGGI